MKRQAAGTKKVIYITIGAGVGAGVFFIALLWCYCMKKTDGKVDRGKDDNTEAEMSLLNKEHADGSRSSNCRSVRSYYSHHSESD